MSEKANVAVAEVKESKESKVHTYLWLSGISLLIGVTITSLFLLASCNGIVLN